MQKSHICLLARIIRPENFNKDNTMTQHFTGLPRESLQFFTELKANNNKIWFDTHKPDSENYILTPAMDFVVVLGEPLRDLSPNVVADPRINKSIFRIYQDIRFSKYITQLH
jgi:uncharacterized protein (DUF2461 family)